MQDKNVVEVNYHQTGKSTNTNELGMREMQARVYQHRNSQYLLVKAPPASGKSRAWTRIYKDKTMKVIMIAKGAAYPYACNQYAKGTVGKAADVTAWFKEADVKKSK